MNMHKNCSELTIHNNLSMALLILRLCWILVLPAAATSMSTNPITLEPTENYTLRYNSNFTIAYTCTVNRGPRVIWVIIGTTPGSECQIQDPESVWMCATSHGIVIENTQPTVSTLKLDKHARQSLWSLSEYSPQFWIGCLPFSSNIVRYPRYFVRYRCDGPLDPPSNLSLTEVSETILQFSWIAPEVPPCIKLTYDVQVINLSSANSEQFTTNNQSITYTFSGKGVCSVFKFVVNATSEQAVKSTEKFISKCLPLGPDVSSIADSLTSNLSIHCHNNVSTINIKFLRAILCCGQFPVSNYTLKIENVTIQVTENCGEFMCVTINNTVIPGSLVDKNISCRIEACNRIACQTTSLIYFTPTLNNMTTLHVPTSCSQPSNSSNLIVYVVYGGVSILIMAVVFVIVVVLLIVWKLYRRKKQKYKLNTVESVANKKSNDKPADTTSGSSGKPPEDTNSSDTETDSPHGSTHTCTRSAKYTRNQTDDDAEPMITISRDMTLTRRKVKS